MHNAPTKFSVLAEIEWPFEDGTPDHNYCLERATFIHGNACEFVIHAGADRPVGPSGITEYAQHRIEEMARFGCSEAFIAAYRDAAKAGAIRILFFC